MLREQDRPLFYAVSAITIALLLNLAAPLAQTGTNEPPENVVALWRSWGFYEALFTGLIVLFAVRQFAEGRRSGERQLRAYLLPELCTIADYNTVIPRPPTIFNDRIGSMMVLKNSGQLRLMMSSIGEKSLSSLWRKNIYW